MATATEPSNVRELLRDDPALAAGDVQRLNAILSGPQLSEARQELRAIEDEIAATDRPSQELLTRAGIACYLIGQHRKADEFLSWVTGQNGAACFYHALVLTALERYDEAEGQFADAAKYGYDAVECTLRRAGVIRAQGRLDEAEQVLRSVSRQAASRAEYSYQMGCILADRGDTYGAVEYFERAVDMDPRHSRALFRLAAENALRGNDDDAVHLYERSLARPPLYLGSLLNLGLLYEDQENYSAAAFCFRKILEADPTHARARLYLKDIEAAGDMYYDDESVRRQAKLDQLLARPISDFELTVRSRNCLQGMNINTLGDLTRVGEQDLLAGKNFGETSLKEVRDLMAAHGLAIGQDLGKPRPLPSYLERDLSPQEQAVLSKSVNELNLSVRARKCMTRLGIATVGELVQKTPDELLSTRNFGVTSLNELRTRLAEINLKLRND